MQKIVITIWLINSGSLFVHIILVDIPSKGEVKRTQSTETHLHGLYKYTNYSIKVSAFTGTGDGVLSLPMFCTTEEDGKFVIIVFLQF